MKNLNVISLNGLRAVEAVGRLGSLQLAARELGVSVGAVSQQVIKAEQQLGHPLFVRQPKGMFATDAGRDLIPHLAEGFRSLAVGIGALRRAEEEVLTISVAPVFAARWLVYRLGDFSDCHPDIRLRIDASSRIIDPGASDVDLCIRVGKGRWPGVESSLLLKQRVFPVCTPSMAGSVKEPADLLKLPAIIDGNAMFTWDVWLARAGLCGIAPTARHVFSEASLCLDAAIAGQGIMLAWQTLASHAIQTGQLVVPFGPFAETGDGHHLVAARGARRSRKVLAFREWLENSLAADMARLEDVVRRQGVDPDG